MNRCQSPEKTSLIRKLQDSTIALTDVYPKRFTGQALRRTFLCGIDQLTGNDYSHRKGWLEERMLELCNISSVEIYAYAVMG